MKVDWCENLEGVNEDEIWELFVSAGIDPFYYKKMV